MKKIIAALSVFAFVFAFSGESVKAMTSDNTSYSVSFTGDKDPKADGTKKADKADKKSSSSSCSSSCSDKSAKASGDCGSKKTATSEASTSSDKK
ncbi:MAG: hypothetical protein IPH20_12345 [Bacteroidales bacterium]|nr:hypothetical protein [Bacteroidales bacterium]